MPPRLPPYWLGRYKSLSEGRLRLNFKRQVQTTHRNTPVSAAAWLMPKMLEMVMMMAMDETKAVRIGCVVMNTAH
jgi:hypothetical protein